mgnify:CR=1 FL=1
MKGIKITQQIKEQNAYSWAQNLNAIVKRTIPKRFFVTENVVGGYQHRTDLHAADGWKDIINPSYNGTTQKLGVLIEDGNTFTYTVIDKTEQEIQNEALSNSESNQQQLIQDLANKKVIEEAQAETDTQTLLDNTDLYPFWEADIDVLLAHKYKHFNDANEIVLYEVIQAHTTQADWQPKDVPALFKRVAFDNEILDWVQPTGAQDAYSIGDQVHHDNPNDNSNIWLYESKINANTTEPGRDGTFDRWWQPINVKP